MSINPLHSSSAVTEHDWKYFSIQVSSTGNNQPWPWPFYYHLPGFIEPLVYVQRSSQGVKMIDQSPFYAKTAVYVLENELVDHLLLIMMSTIEIVCRFDLFYIPCTS